MDEQIYHQPENYDLEHAQTEPDVGFFVGPLEQWRPRQVLELACGNGRVSFALARRLARWSGRLTRATRYFAHEQRASVHFLYDKLQDESAVTERFLSDYECHVCKTAERKFGQAGSKSTLA